jgi:hypothetical protein
MRPVYTALLILLLAAIGIAGGTYSDLDHGFQITPPDNWDLIAMNPDEASDSVLFISPADTPDDDKDHLGILVQYLDGSMNAYLEEGENGADPTELVDELKATIRDSEETEVRILGTTNKASGTGEDKVLRILIEYEAGEGEEIYAGYEGYILWQDQALIFIAGGPKREYDPNQATVKAVAKSLGPIQ